MKLWIIAALPLFAAFNAQAARKPPVVTVQGPPPIQITPIFRPEVFGSWTVTRVEGTTYMATTNNNASSAFGMFCTDGGCVPFFNPQITCDDNRQYPALVNSAGGAFTTTGTCTKAGDRYIMLLPDSRDINEAMTIGGDLGIAFPMQSGQFAISRFSLTGSLRATARAQQLSRGYSKPAAPIAGGDDTRL